MVRSEFQQLTQALGTAVLRGINPSNATEVWRRIVNQLSGDLDDEATFDETRPISEYMTMALGIPIKSELLGKSVVQIKRMQPSEVAELRYELEELVTKMNHFDNEMNPEGTRFEKHWFLMHGMYYAWVPLEIMP